MALLELILSKCSDSSFWIALVLGLVTAYVVHFYYRVRKLPPGPFPLPFIGNILQLRGKIPLYKRAIEWSREYGDPFTVWVGPRPFVIAANKDSFKDISGPLRNLLAGRPQTNAGDAQLRGNVDVVFSDFNPAWDVLRRLAHVAMRKYAQTEKLASLTSKIVDGQVEEVFGNKTETKFELMDYIEGVVNNILAISSFGESFKKGDQLYDRLRSANKLFEENASNGFPSDIHPLLAWIFFRQEAAARSAMDELLDISDIMFSRAKNSWVKGQSRHFTDVLLNAREEFLDEDRASSKYLNDANLNQVLVDIFGAGTNTSRSVLGFCFLILANKPELQEELRQEIIDAIGSNSCSIEDRARLPNVDAFLQEVIRLHPAAPMSVPRKAMADVTVNGRSIPKDTAVFIDVYAVNHDKSIWGPDADTFNHKRYLKASKDQLGKGTNSFGIGARSCPGEKLAQADIFYTIVRTLQKTKLSGLRGPESVDLTFVGSDLLLDPLRQQIVFTKVQ